MSEVVDHGLCYLAAILAALAAWWIAKNTHDWVDILAAGFLAIVAIDAATIRVKRSNKP